MYKRYNNNKWLKVLLDINKKSVKKHIKLSLLQKSKDCKKLTSYVQIFFRFTYRFRKRKRISLSVTSAVIAINESPIFEHKKLAFYNL